MVTIGDCSIYNNTIFDHMYIKQLITIIIEKNTTFFIGAMRPKLYLAFGDTFICAPLIKTSAPNSNDRHSVINTGVRGHCMKLTRTRAFGELLLRGECFDNQISISFSGG